MRTDQVGDDSEPRLGVRRTFCPLLSRQLGLIRRNSVHLNNEKREEEDRKEQRSRPRLHLCPQGQTTAPAAQAGTTESRASLAACPQG